MGLSPSATTSKPVIAPAATGIIDPSTGKPVGANDPDTFMVRAVSLTLPSTTSWVDFGRPHMRATLGADFGYKL